MSISLADFYAFTEATSKVATHVKNTVEANFITEQQIEEKIPEKVLPLYDSLHKMLSQCGKIKSGIDDNTLKLIIKSIVRMQKSLDNRDDSVNQSIRNMLDDLQTNLSQDTT